MRATRIIIIALVLFIVVAVGVYLLLNLGGGGDTAAPVSTGPDTAGVPAQSEGQGSEPGLPPPTPTPAYQLVGVVVATEDIPMGTRLTADMLSVAPRPDNNIAVVAGVTLSDPAALLGQFARTDIHAGQEILSPMLGLQATDLAGFGSDLSLYVNQGQVAVAFPIDSFTGIAYSLRPGDLVDVIMSLTMIQIDPEFHSALPNTSERVDQQALQEGQSFLFSATGQGRLELVPELNLVAEILPGGEGAVLPRQVTQLTVQQAEVLWVGSWGPQAPDLTVGGNQAAGAGEAPAESPTGEAGAVSEQSRADIDRTSDVTRAVLPARGTPDVVILSLTSQDALALKWAQESGVALSLALRAQGDNSTFVTSSVSLPISVEQGLINVPESGDFDLDTRYEEVPVPFLPLSPPGP